MRFAFHPRADEEFEDAVRYYEEYQPGLGLDFAEELNGVIFQVKCGMLLVIAVSNLHRRPDQWRSRIFKRS